MIFENSIGLFVRHKFLCSKTSEIWKITVQLIKMQNGIYFCSMRIFLGEQLKRRGKEDGGGGWQKEKDISQRWNTWSPFSLSMSQKVCIYWSQHEVVYTELQDYILLRWTIHVSKLPSSRSVTSFNVFGVYSLLMLLQQVLVVRETTASIAF